VTTREQFIARYCEASNLTRAFYDANCIALPCDCGNGTCAGWATVGRTPMSVLVHLDFDLFAQYGRDIKAAELKERERCAKVCEDYAKEKEEASADEEDADYKERFLVYAKHVRKCAAAIRQADAARAGEG
jgi:hypothetical protein